MASAPKHPLPEGFAQWSAREKIEYVQRLWQLILEEHPAQELPVHDWQREAIQEAREEHQRASLA